MAKPAIGEGGGGESGGGGGQQDGLLAGGIGQVKINQVRVAECQSFYMDQHFQAKFYPKKIALIATVLAPKMTRICNRDTFGEQMLAILQCVKFRQRNLIYCAIFFLKRLNFAKLCALPNFYPNLPIFLHGSIRHIRDILQL